MRALPVNIPENLRNIRIILFEPQEPGNIGQTARAMKGMGMSDLVLVNPVKWRDLPDAWKMACASKDILENCLEVRTLSEALDGIQYLVGTTHRKRRGKLPPAITAREAAKRVATISQNQTVALLFGREDHGLTTEQLSMCQIYASVPMATRNPSLNLSHAVLIFSYEIFLASLSTDLEMKEKRASDEELASVIELEHFYKRIMSLLTRVDFAPNNDDWSSLLYAFRRVFGKIQLQRRDLHTLYQIFSTIDKYLIRIQKEQESGGAGAQRGKMARKQEGISGE